MQVVEAVVALRGVEDEEKGEERVTHGRNLPIEDGKPLLTLGKRLSVLAQREDVNREQHVQPRLTDHARKHR